MGLMSELYAPQRPDFKGYTTNVRLKDASLKKTELVRFQEPGLSIWRFDYISHYDNGITLYQRSVESNDIDTTCKYKVVGEDGDYFRTCKELPLKNGGHYVVSTDKYKGKLFNLSVVALIGNTALGVSIPKEKLDIFAAYDGWQSFFDSMRPVDLTGMPFRRETTRHVGS